MRVALLLTIGLVPASAFAHELERTQVSIAFQRDGSFVVDVANDPAWLILRLEPFAGGAIPPGPKAQDRDRRLAELARVFADRIVLFVDGHEVRPESAEYIRPPQVAQGVYPSPLAQGFSPAISDALPLGTYRLRGRLPDAARTLRWFYGIVIDPYPLTIRHSDGRSSVMWIAGEAWSAPIDVSGEFQRTRWIEAAALVAVTVALLALRWQGRRAKGNRVFGADPAR